MTLETIYYIGQTIAVVVIIATLIALLIQTRQTNALARAETSRSHMYWFAMEQHRLFATPEDAAFMHKALRTSEPLTDEEKGRFAFSMALMFSLVEAAQQTHQTGLFRDTDYDRALDTTRMAYLNSPRVRKWWAYTRTFYTGNPDFVAVIDKLVAEVEEDAKKGETP